MDLKDRINALTEVEAKAALLRSLDILAQTTICDYCRIKSCAVMYGNLYDYDKANCMEHWLEEALK